MQILKAIASAEQLIKKSRFVAVAAPLTDATKANAVIGRLALADASHNCWAWRSGQQYRSSDDGEPGGSAGRPILAAIDGAGLDHTAVVVSRYYGGIKLGVGGLIRAYGGTAAQCLNGASTRVLVASEQVTLRVQFSATGAVYNLLDRFGARIVAERYLAQGLSMTVEVRSDRLADLRHALADATRGSAQLVTTDPGK